MRALAVVVGILFSLAACAKEEAASAAPKPAPQKPAANYVAGKHYQVISPAVRTSTKNHVEIVEVFWYGCGHCYHFESALHKWEETLPSYAKLVQSPAMWAGHMRTHAKVFYTARALGVLDKVHSKIFDAMHKDKKRLVETDEIAVLFETAGVEKDKFMKVFDSFSIESQVQQADSRARGYKITGTPEMIVNGKYRVSSRMAGSQEEMLKVVEYLAAKEAE